LLQSQLITSYSSRPLYPCESPMQVEEHQSKYNSVKELILREHYTSMEQPTGRDSENHDGGDVQVLSEVWTLPIALPPLCDTPSGRFADYWTSLSRTHAKILPIVTGHFAYKRFCLLDTSPAWQTVRLLSISPRVTVNGRLVRQTVHHIGKCLVGKCLVDELSTNLAYDGKSEMLQWLSQQVWSLHLNRYWHVWSLVYFSPNEH